MIVRQDTTALDTMFHRITPQLIRGRKPRRYRYPSRRIRDNRTRYTSFSFGRRNTDRTAVPYYRLLDLVVYTSISESLVKLFRPELLTLSDKLIFDLKATFDID